MRLAARAREAVGFHPDNQSPNRLKILLAFLALSSALALGQSPAKHTCRILFLDGPDSAPDTLHLFDGTASREVELPRMNFSQVYELKPGNLVLRLLPEAVDDPEQVPPGAPSARIPAAVTDFYLLVTSDPGNAVAPVRLQVINANADRLKRGQMLWFNLTGNTIGGTVGSEKLVIQPNARTILDPPARTNTNYPVNLAFRIPGKEHLYPLCETRWRHDPRSRSVAFVITKPGVRTPRVMVFPDYREPPAKEDS